MRHRRRRTAIPTTRVGLDPRKKVAASPPEAEGLTAAGAVMRYTAFMRAEGDPVSGRLSPVPNVTAIILTHESRPGPKPDQGPFGRSGVSPRSWDRAAWSFSERAREVTRGGSSAATKSFALAKNYRRDMVGQRMAGWMKRWWRPLVQPIWT